jgi:hypothetical protein
MPRKCIEVRRKGKVEVTGTDTVVTLGLARDRKRIWSRPGAGWVDLDPKEARQIAEALLLAADAATPVEQ